MDEAEFQMLCRSKLLVPRQSLLFKLDPVNTLSVGEVRRFLAADANAYANLILAANKDHESSSIGDILDLAEKFHIIPKVEGWSVDDLGCSCVGCYKLVHCCHARLVGMVLDANVKVPKAREIAEPAVRKGRVMGRGTAGQIRQKRKRLLAAIAADKKKNVKKSRTLHIEGPGVTFLTLASFIFHTNPHRSCVPSGQTLCLRAKPQLLAQYPTVR